MGLVGDISVQIKGKGELIFECFLNGTMGSVSWALFISHNNPEIYIRSQINK